MKIAFISYEYPPDTALGGIATYVGQAAPMLARRGHHVEVFSGSRHRTGTNAESGITVHRLQCEETMDFHRWIGPVFTERHRTVGFDVLEGPEYRADASDAVCQVPDIPLVVKLHTPTYLIHRMNDATPLLTKTRMIVGAIRRGIPHQWHPGWGGERLHTLDADEITTPSDALGKIMIKAWGLDPTKVCHIPNLYIPAPELLEVPSETQTDTITFFGRLEQRKGVLDLAAAIPFVLQRNPDARFRFIGRPLKSPTLGLDMRQYLQKVLQPYAQSVEILEPVPLHEVPGILTATDICVFPSLWENFPNVCLESMAAARGIVASRAGGMAEMLDGGRCGELISPHRPRQMAAAICRLLDDPKRRTQLGVLARERVVGEYNSDRIGALQEASYIRAIKRRRQAGPRRSVSDPPAKSLSADPKVETIA